MHVRVREGGVTSLLLVRGDSDVHGLYNLLLELPHSHDVPSLLSPQVSECKTVTYTVNVRVRAQEREANRQTGRKNILST